MKQSNIGLLIILPALSLACAHARTENALNEKVSQTSVHTRADLVGETTQTIDSAPGLTDEQRAQLKALRETTKKQIDDMWTDSIQLRSVLIKDLLTPKYNENEVELIKKKLKQNEDKRLSIMFEAIGHANLILGRLAFANQGIVRDFFIDAHGTRD